MPGIAKGGTRGAMPPIDRRSLNKGPGGAYFAHLNWRKLPSGDIVLYQLFKSYGGPPLDYFLHRAPSPIF